MGTHEWLLFCLPDFFFFFFLPGKLGMQSLTFIFLKTPKTY